MKANALSLPTRGALSHSDAAVLALTPLLSPRAPATLRKALWLLYVVVAAVSSALGGTIYVAPYKPTQPALIGTGTSTDPYRSPANAFAAAANGDTIRFLSGLHYGTLTLNKRLRLEKAADTGTAAIGGVNQAPHVDTGTNIVLIVGGTEWPAGKLAYCYPQAVVTDDYLPPNARYMTSWVKVSGPDTVNVQDMGLPTGWRFAFSGYGSYVFRVAVSDGELSGTDELVVTVQPSDRLSASVTANSSPVTPPGSGVLPAQYALQASATANGQPVVADHMTWYWWQLSGPGTVQFGNRRSAQTSAWFPAFGTYRVAVRGVLDDNVSGAETVTLTIIVSSGGNESPVITGSSEMTLVLGETAPLGELQPACKTLPFTVTDDGKPSGVLTNRWTVRENRPNGLVTFSDPSLANPRVCINRNGEYVLRLTATDGVLSVTNDLRVFVELPASRYLAFTGENFIGGPRKEWVENTCQKASIAFRATLSRPDIMPSPAPVQVAMTLAPKEKQLLGNYGGWRVDLSYCAYTATPLNASSSNGPTAAVVEDLNGWQPSAESGTPIITLTKPGKPGLAGQAAELELYGDYNYEYEVQATTNLLDWVPVGTWPGGPVGIAITDEGARQLPNRFYRVLRR